MDVWAVIGLGYGLELRLGVLAGVACAEGIKLMVSVGISEKTVLGLRALMGLLVGREGMYEGPKVNGIAEGMIVEGTIDGMIVGKVVGSSVIGAAVGSPGSGVGRTEGVIEGVLLGPPLGATVGAFVGTTVGV